MLKDWKEGEGLWLKNQRRLSTTDALSVDWFYCKNPTTKPVEKDGINPEFIDKLTVQCVQGDQLGENRPVYKDRICDGFVDCYHQSDEDGRLAQCQIRIC